MNSTFDLKPERVAQLLAAGWHDDSGQAGAAAGDAEDGLRELMTRPVSLRPALPESLAAVLERPCEEMAPHVGRAIGDLILDAETGIAELETLKDYGKQLVHHARTPPARAAATCLYYAAIAAALVRHHRKITEHSSRKLIDALADLEDRPWTPPELKQLFRAARAVCEEPPLHRPPGSA